MNTKQLKIREGLKRIATSYGPDTMLDGTITAVDTENYFCDVELDSGGILNDCRLRALVAGNKSIDILPKLGSAVVVARLPGGEYLVLACDEIDDLRFAASGFEVQINGGGVAVRKDGESVKSILNDLVDEIIGIAAPKDIAGLQLIKTRIEALLQQ